jgi:hypothetical protein
LVPTCCLAARIVDRTDVARHPNASKGSSTRWTGSASGSGSEDVPVTVPFVLGRAASDPRRTTIEPRDMVVLNLRVRRLLRWRCRGAWTA